MVFSFMLPIFLICLLFVLLTCTASSISHDEECLALFQFKQMFFHQYHESFNSRGFQKLDSWQKITSRNASDSGYDCCLWNGVVCSNDGYVIGLDLSQSSLHGRINSNSTLFNLVHLQMLDLSMNNFVQSQIPAEIGRLKQLKSINLSDSSFSGQIPIEISHLTHLSSLDLSSNQLKLHSPSLESLLQNLTRLEQLHLSRLDVSSSIPHFLVNFSFLRSIDLEDCQLRDEFPSKIFHLQNLKHLNIALNPDLTGSLPEFYNDTLLEHLGLHATSFAGIIPKSINKLNRLVVLELSSCYLSGCIPGNSFLNMTQLTYLSLGQEELMGLLPSMPKPSKPPIILRFCDDNSTKGHLYDWIGKLTNLVELFVVRTTISQEIIPSLANLTKLNFLVMRETSISGHISSSFMNLTQLKVIDVRGNQLQGQISSSFSNFKTLEYLFLSSNHFTGRVTLDTFVGLNKLNTLSLGDNRLSFVPTSNYTNGTLTELEHIDLSSCNLKEFPSFLRFLKKIQILILYNNTIRGLVPEWIWNNSQKTLLYLDLKDNLITGFQQLPFEIPWVRLEVINIENNQLQGQLPIPPNTTIVYDVSHNNITGEIPPLICEIKSLQYLDLSSNNMIGTLPPCLDKLSNSLLVLDLKENNFHGQMMESFKHGCSLKVIDLSENQFTGQVSKSFANCSNLEVLNLGENSFGGGFPLWLGNLEELQVLSLRSNKFHGAIHGLTGITSQFLKLRIIDLSNNCFSGQLPEKIFQTWNAMKSNNVGKSFVMELSIPFYPRSTFQFPYSVTLTKVGIKREFTHFLNILTAIDLSCNNFEGHIPQSLEDLQGLMFLNLSNNHITGHVFPSLVNLKNLECLDLSHNELSGEIPQQLSQLNFLANFNVSFNHLNGRIPHGKQFDTFDNNSYVGNQALCGKPLSKDCESLVVSTLSPTPTGHHCESLLPTDRIDWIFLFFGVGSGLVIGIICGNFVYARYGDWLIEKFGMKKDVYVRPVSNRKRNHVVS